MAHRRTSNPPQFFQTSNPSQYLEIDQDWSYGHSVTGASHEYLGRMGAPSNATFSDPNPSTSGLNSASRRNLESRSIDHSSGNFRFEGQQVHTRLPGPSHDVLSHFPRVDSYPVPETNAAYSHSSHYNRHIIHEVEAGLVDHMIGTGRGPFKRKSPDLSVPWERGSSSAVYSEGSSSSSFELQVEKPTSDYRNHPSASTGLPPYVGGGLLIGGEDPPRNVRSRSRLDLEPNPRRSYLSSHFSRPSYSASHLQNHPVPSDITNSNADANAYDQNLIGVSPPAYGRIHTSANNSSSQEMNQYYVEGNPVDTGGNHHDSILSINPMVPHQYHYGFNPQAALEGHGSYSRRTLHSRRTELRSSVLGQEAVGLDNCRQHLSEPFSSRHLRQLPAGNWHNNNREGRPRVAMERFQSFSNAVDARDRAGPEALMMLDHSYLYGSRNLLDQYRDMRLDVDNMSYEELLDLGERIGHVNTGFSEDVILKCLTVTVFPPADKTQEEMSCAICLEEYKNMDKVGTVKSCGHGYHVDCITKWLSMKNACPICKAPAVNDGSGSNQD